MNELQTIAQRLKQEINITDYHNNFTIDTAMQAVAAIFSENGGYPRCTAESKYKSILSMVVMGLNPLKGQCYFVPYGNQLQLQLDYSGAIMVARREDPRIASINAKVVRKGDKFDIDTINGIYTFKHKPTIQSLNGEIIAAYAIAIDAEGTVIDSDIMTIEDIKTTWKNTNTRHKGEPVVRQDGSLHPGSNHGKWPEKMTAKTVVHRLCRSIIKSSSNVQVDENEIVVSEISPEPEKIELIDFKAEGQTAGEISPEPEPPCNPKQAEQITELFVQSGQPGPAIEATAKFFNREIKRFRDITQIEATQFLIHLTKLIEAKKEAEDKDDEPEWG